MSLLDREYLEDYDQKERAEFNKLEKAILENRFQFGKDRYPSNERFVRLQKPVALAVGTETIAWSTIWSQIPFSGSLVLLIPPCSKENFEKMFFKESEIPEIINFIKKEGRLQIASIENHWHMLDSITWTHSSRS